MPRAGLTTARVIDEAAQLADEVGLSGLTLAALAERLGVRYPSLYKHVDGLDGLQRGLAVQAKNELAGTLARATVGRARGDAIVAVAHAYRTWALKHPGRYAAAQRVPAPGDTEAAAADWASVEVIGAILAGYDLHDDDAVDATRALRAALHGFVTLETTFVHPASIDRSFDRLVQGLATALASWAEPSTRMTGLQLQEGAQDAPHGGQLVGCDGTKAVVQALIGHRPQVFWPGEGGKLAQARRWRSDRNLMTKAPIPAGHRDHENDGMRQGQVPRS